MRFIRFLAVVPLVAAASITLGSHAEAANPCPILQRCPTPSPGEQPSPSPQPPPSIELSTATGSPGDSVSVNGSYFDPNEQIHIDWDNNPKQLLGAQTADVNGNFKVTVKLPNQPAGTHTICTVEAPQPCASIGLLAAAPTPSPSPSPSPTPSPSPSPSPSPADAGPLGGPSYPSASDTGLVGELLTPPLLFLWLLLLAGGGALGVWWWRSRGLQPALQTAHVVHSSGGAVDTSGSGWHREPAPEPPAAQPPPAAEPPSEPEPPARPWTSPGGDEPPDHPQPGE